MPDSMIEYAETTSFGELDVAIARLIAERSAPGLPSMSLSAAVARICQLVDIETPSDTILPEDLGCPEFGGVAKLTSRYGTRRRWPLAGLELEWRQHAERRVSALTVVEGLQVLEERGGQLQARGPGLPVQQLDLHPAPERLHQGVVEARADRAHRG